MEKAAQKALAQLQFWLDLRPTQETTAARAETVIERIQAADAEVRPKLATLLTRLETDSSQGPKRGYWINHAMYVAGVVAARLQAWEDLLQDCLNAERANVAANSGNVGGKMGDWDANPTPPNVNLHRGIVTPDAARRQVVPQGAHSIPGSDRHSAEDRPRTSQSLDPDLRTAPTNKEALKGWEATSQLHSFTEQPTSWPQQRPESLDLTWTGNPTDTSFTHDRFLGPGYQSDINCEGLGDPNTNELPQTDPLSVSSLRQESSPEKSQENPADHDDGAHHPEAGQTTARNSQREGTDASPTPTICDTRIGRPTSPPQNPSGVFAEAQLQYVTNVILGQQRAHPLHQLAKREVELWRGSEVPVVDLQSIGAPLVTESASTSTPRKVPTPREASVLLSKFPTVRRITGMDIRYHPRLISETQTSQDLLGNQLSAAEQIVEPSIRQVALSVQDCRMHQVQTPKTDRHPQVGRESYPNDGTNGGLARDTLRSEVFYTPLAVAGHSASTKHAPQDLPLAGLSSIRDEAFLPSPMVWKQEPSSGHVRNANVQVNLTGQTAGSGARITGQRGRTELLSEVPQGTPRNMTQAGGGCQTYCLRAAAQSESNPSNV